MRKFCSVKSFIFKAQKFEKMFVRDFYGNREFHVSFWSMIYLTLKFGFNAIVTSELDFNFNRK